MILGILGLEYLICIYSYILYFYIKIKEKDDWECSLVGEYLFIKFKILGLNFSIKKKIKLKIIEEKNICF